MTHQIHIVGSMPLKDSEEVFTTLGSVLGAAVKRMPDGETGERNSWVGWLGRIFGQNPALELSSETWKVHEGATAHRRYRMKAGMVAKDVRVDNLPYADFACESYDVFRRLRDAGKVPVGTKFQVDFAPAHSAVRSHIAEDLLPTVEPVFDDAIRREVDKIAAAIPHQDLAFQFDAASAVFKTLQNVETGIHGGSKEEIAATFTAILAKLGNHVPADIDLMFHFCYGDNNHRHSVEPIDMGDMADMANRLLRAMTRPINLIHMPVPRDRDDDAYFAPLKNLDLAPETEIALGLLHLTGGIDGVKKRLATARKHLKTFSLATECGMGRRKADTIPELLRVHAQAAALD